MVLLINGYEVASLVTASDLHTSYLVLRDNSLRVLRRPSRQVEANEKCLYVGQREMAVVAPGDHLNLIGSEDATTCHIVIIREVRTGVTGLAHLDRDQPGDFLAMERELRDRVR